MSFKTDMRRFAADLRAAVDRGMKHWSVDMWVGYIDDDCPVYALDRPECGCLFGGTVSTRMSGDMPLAIEMQYPSFGNYYDDESPAADISDASERGVDFASMADFIDGTPDWALDEYERGLGKDGTS